MLMTQPTLLRLRTIQNQTISITYSKKTLVGTKESIIGSMNSHRRESGRKNFTNLGHKLANWNLHGFLGESVLKAYAIDPLSFCPNEPACIPRLTACKKRRCESSCFNERQHDCTLAIMSLADSSPNTPRGLRRRREGIYGGPPLYEHQRDGTEACPTSTWSTCTAEQGNKALQLYQCVCSFNQ